MILDGGYAGEKIARYLSLPQKNPTPLRALPGPLTWKEAHGYYITNPLKKTP